MTTGLMIYCILLQAETEFVDLHRFVKDLQAVARPHSQFSPTSVLRRKRTEQLKAVFLNQHAEVDLKLESSVDDIVWKNGVANIKLMPMLTRWKKTGFDVPLKLVETATVDVIMTHDQALAVMRESRVIIEAHALKTEQSVSESGAPHGQFLFSCSSKRFGISIGSYATRNYKVTIGDQGPFAGYWDQTATVAPNKKRSVEANF